MAAFPPRDEPAFMAHWARILERPEVSAWAVLTDEGAVAGNVVAFELDGTPLVGYWIGREHWGRGIASRALPLLLEDLEERPLHATVAPHNAASLRVLEKSGFSRVGERDGVLVLRLGNRAPPPATARPRRGHRPGRPSG